MSGVRPRHVPSGRVRGQTPDVALVAVSWVRPGVSSPAVPGSDPGVSPAATLGPRAFGVPGPAGAFYLGACVQSVQPTFRPNSLPSTGKDVP